MDKSCKLQTENTRKAKESGNSARGTEQKRSTTVYTLNDATGGDNAITGSTVADTTLRVPKKIGGFKHIIPKTFPTNS